MSAWNEINLEPEITSDGSPSLIFIQEDSYGKKESMHHSGGAYLETQLIYGDLIRECLQQKARSFLVVGLGLGYIELLVALESLRFQAPSAEMRLTSFESVELLKQWFKLWLEDSSQLHPDIRQTYELMNTAFLKDYSKEELQAGQQLLMKWLSNSQWELKGSFEFDHQTTHPYQCIAFDAYSTKTSPDVWQEEGMIQFFKTNADLECQLGTYASNGILKRSLAASGFSFEERRGFTGKRNSGRGIKKPQRAL